MRGTNPTLCAAIIREMPNKPDDAKEWFAVFTRTATEMRDSMMHEAAADMRKTIKAIDRILEYCRTGQ